MDQGGGVVYDLGTHLIDQVVVAFGMPRRVTAMFQWQRQDGSEEPDAITVLLGYEEGAHKGLLVTVKAGVIGLATQQLRYWVRGTEGTWMKLCLDVQEDQLKAGLKPGDKGFGVEPEEHSGLLTKMEGDKPVKNILRNVEPETYGALYRRFGEAIQKGDEELVPVKVSEVRDVLRIIEAAKESAKTGRTMGL
jgi:predicted dehydrogenase